MSKLTTYVDQETHTWLCTYASRLGLKRSELIKLLIVREQRNQWLEKAMDLSDAEIGSPSPENTSG